MLVRERLAISAAALALALGGLLSGCSSDNPRDINYGTDVAINFVPPDASVTNDGDALAAESGNPVDGVGVEVAEVAGAASGRDEVGALVDSMVDSALDVDAAIGGAN
jgi:hypothetical protein